MEEYAEWCAWEDTALREQTEATATETLAEEFLDILLIEPPPELRHFHDALIRATSVLLLLPDDFEEAGTSDEDETLIWSLLFLLIMRGLEQEAEVLPEDLRATLADAGCLWTDEAGEAVADPSSGPADGAPEDSARGVTDSPRSWDTLGQVLERGELRCGVRQTLPLFGFREPDGSVSGFEIEFCKALAAAVLGDPNKVAYVDASDAATRFDMLATGEIDVLIGASTISASRDRKLGIDFVQPIFYMGQGFAVRRDSGIDSIWDMDAVTICVQTGGPLEQNAADRFTELGLDYIPLGGIAQDVADAFFTRRCDVLTADVSELASRISVRTDADDYAVLPRVISKEPLAPAVREHDSEWRDIVNWVVHGLIAAEELGITQANVHPLAANPPNPEIARLLGVPYNGDEVAMLGFHRIGAQFIQRAIAAVGNYGEVYARTVGDYLPRACTLNDLVINNDGCPAGQSGIMYAFPYR